MLNVVFTYDHGQMASCFNLVRLRAKSLFSEVCMQELLYADHFALVAQSLEDLQALLDRSRCMLECGPSEE